jgi:hypothetical protein
MLKGIRGILNKITPSTYEEVVKTHDKNGKKNIPF